MVNEFATVGGSQTFSHFPKKPLIVVHEALYSLLHKGVRITPALGGKPGKPSLQVRTKIYFHATRVRAEAPCVKCGARRRRASTGDHIHACAWILLKTELDRRHFRQGRRAAMVVWSLQWKTVA